jgi:hypothetical protein
LDFKPHEELFDEANVGKGWATACPDIRIIRVRFSISFVAFRRGALYLPHRRDFVPHPLAPLSHAFGKPPKVSRRQEARLFCPTIENLEDFQESALTDHPRAAFRFSEHSLGTGIADSSPTDCFISSGRRAVAAGVGVDGNGGVVLQKGVRNGLGK